MTCLAQARAMLAVLGLDPLAPAWQAGDPGRPPPRVVDALVALALRQRDAARARGDYASADSIRDTLEDFRGRGRGHAGRHPMGTGAVSAPGRRTLTNWRSTR